jgi:chromosome segregation ATPase
MLSQLNAVAASAQSDVLVLQQRMEATASAWRITNETAEQKMEVLVTQIGETNTQVTNLFAALETQRAATASLNDSVSDMLRRMDTIIARMDVNDAERSAKTPRTDGGSHP